MVTGPLRSFYLLGGAPCILKGKTAINNNLMNSSYGRLCARLYRRREGGGHESTGGFFQSMNWGSLQDFLLRIAAFAVYHCPRGKPWTSRLLPGGPNCKGAPPALPQPYSAYRSLWPSHDGGGGIWLGKAVPVDMRYFKHRKAGWPLLHWRVPCPTFFWPMWLCSLGPYIPVIDSERRNGNSGGQ